MEESNEPEIDAAIAEQEAINRMRWQLFSRVFNGVDDLDALLGAADTATSEYIDRFGVVK